MDIDGVVLKLQNYPWYMDNGAGKLSKRFNCARQTIYDAKDIVRGKKSAKPNLAKILILDIETAPMKAYVWSRWKQNIYLDQTISEWFMICWSAKWLYSGETMGACCTPKEVRAEDDVRIVKDLWKLVNEASIVVAHNGKKFDIPKINSRFILAGLNPPTPYTQIDTKEVSAKRFGFSSNKLDALATYFGIPNKDDTDFELWVKCLAGDKESLDYMQTYNKHDVEILEEVYLVLRPWILAHPNVALYADDNVDRCCTCGSDDIEQIDGNYYYTSVGKYQMFRCSCGAISRGRRSILSKDKNKSLLTSTAK